MFDHVTIRVADLAASQRFYATTLGAAGIEDWQDFRIEPAAAPTRRLHIGFSVPSREHVHAFWDAGVAAGYTDDGEPGLRPQYTDDYYGGFLLDPDGNSAEAVHHAGVRRAGNVDHVWMRVADLTASRTFYESIAADAGYRLNKELPGRVAFVSDRPDGGDFSIVEGEPTEHVHLAFPAGREQALMDPDGNWVELVGRREPTVSVAFHGLTTAQDLEAGHTDAASVSPALPTILRALADRDLDATFFVSDQLREREPLAVTMIANGRHEVAALGDEPEATVRDAPYLMGDGPEGEPAGANALHQALQLAVAGALRGHTSTILAFTPGLLERADTLAVFVETLELVEGLRAAGSLRVATVGELAG